MSYTIYSYYILIYWHILLIYYFRSNNKINAVLQS